MVYTGKIYIEFKNVWVAMMIVEEEMNHVVSSIFLTTQNTNT